MSVVCLLQRDVVMFGLPAIFISGPCALKLLPGTPLLYADYTFKVSYLRHCNVMRALPVNPLVETINI